MSDTKTKPRPMRDHITLFLRRMLACLTVYPIFIFMMICISPVFAIIAFSRLIYCETDEPMWSWLWREMTEDKWPEHCHCDEPDPTTDGR